MRLISCIGLVLVLTMTSMAPRTVLGETPKCPGTKVFHGGKCRYPSEVKKPKKAPKKKRSQKKKPRSDFELARFWAPFVDGTAKVWGYGAKSRSPKSGFPVLDSRGAFDPSRSLENLFNWGIDECVKRYLGLAPDDWVSEADLIKALTGEELVIGTVDGRFPKYNAKAIKGLFLKITPDSDDHTGNQAVSRIYPRLYRNITRTYALCYLFLQNLDGGLKKEAEAFRQLIPLSKFRCPTWTGSRYKRSFSVFAAGLPYLDSWLVGSSQWGAEPDVFCFWLRRQLDGTAVTLATGIGILLRRYDSDFVKDHGKEMRHFPKRFK